MNPSLTLPVIDFVYPVTSFSSTVYTISFPLLYLANFSNVCFHSFESFNVTVSFTTPSAYNVISTAFLNPSWLLLSSQVFSTLSFPVLSLINSGVCVFLILFPVTTVS